jgi:cytochrome P450
MQTATISMESLRDPQVRRDPYPFYRTLRETAPVLWDNARGEWVFSRYHDVVALLRHPGISSNYIPSTGHLSASARSAAQTISRLLLFIDPPDHARLRRLISKTFTPRMIERLRPTITEQVDTLIDAVAGRGRMDLMDELAFPLPLTVIAVMLGVPSQDIGLLREWSRPFRYMVDDRTLIPADELPSIMATIGEFLRYLSALADERQRVPRDDLISQLVAVEQDGDRLTRHELVTNVLLLIAAGHGTTVHLIANGTLALLRNPGQWERLKTDQAITPAAVTELLRYVSPVQITERVAATDIEVAGHRVAAGEHIRLVLAAANRDPEVFPDPDRLDLDRSPSPQHMAFGHGIHACIGMALARLEGEIAFGRLAARMPTLRVEDDTAIEWEDTVNYHGPRHLPVAWD